MGKETKSQRGGGAPEVPQPVSSMLGGGSWAVSSAASKHCRPQRPLFAHAGPPAQLTVLYHRLEDSLEHGQPRSGPAQQTSGLSDTQGSGMGGGLCLPGVTEADAGCFNARSFEPVVLIRRMGAFGAVHQLSHSVLSATSKEKLESIL